MRKHSIIAKLLSFSLAMLMLFSAFSVSANNADVAEVAEDEEVTVYFVNYGNWETVNAYVWDDSKNEVASWPGLAMTKTTEKVSGCDVYSYTFDAKYNNIIFNNGKNDNEKLNVKTEDLKVNVGQYFTRGKWYASVDKIPEKTTVYFNKPADWEGAYIHLMGPDNFNAITEYPGKSMIQVEGDKYSYEVPSEVFGIKFSNGWKEGVSFSHRRADNTAEIVCEATYIIGEEYSSGKFLVSYEKTPEEEPETTAPETEPNTTAPTIEPGTTAPTTQPGTSAPETQPTEPAYELTPVFTVNEGEYNYIDEDGKITYSGVESVVFDFATNDEFTDEDVQVQFVANENDNNWETPTSVEANGNGGYKVTFNVDESIFNGLDSTFYAGIKYGSYTAEKTVLIDAEAPEVEISGVEDKWYKEDVKINVSANEEDCSFAIAKNGATLDEAKVDNGIYTAAESGEYTFTATDKLGNTSASKSVKVKIDRNAPVAKDFTVTFANSESGADKVLRFLTFGLYSNSKLKVTVDVATAEGTAPIKDIAVSIEGIDGFKNNDIIPYGDVENLTIEDIKFRAEDEAGNKSEEFALKTEGVKVKVYGDDTLKNMGEFGNIVYSQSAPEFNHAIIGVSGDVDYATYGSTVALSSTTDEIKVKINVTDEIAGLLKNGIKVYYDKVSAFDTTGDEASSYAPNATTSATTDESFALEDADKSQVESCVFEIAVSVATEDEYVLLIEAENNCGNKEFYALSFVVDKVAPVVNGVTVENSDDWTKEKTVKVYAEDEISAIASVVYKTATEDEGEKAKFANGAYTFNATESGTYYIVVTDVFDNARETKIDVEKIDTTNPIIGEFAKDPSDWTNKDVKVSFAASDEVSYVAAVEVFDETGASIASYDQAQAEYSFVAEDNGVYNVKVTDAAGNIENAKVTIDNIDRTTPTIDEFAMDPGDWTNKDVTVSFAASDDESGVENVEVEKNGKAYFVATADEFSFVADDNGVYNVKVTDAVGNFENATVTIDSIDRITPNIGEFAMDPGNWTNKDVTVSFAASDDESGVKDVKVEKDGKPYTVTSAGDKYSFVADSNGTYLVTVTDAAQNYVTETVKIINIDADKPGISKITGIPDEWGFAPVTFSFTASDDESGIDRVEIYNAENVLVASFDQAQTEYSYEVMEYQAFYTVKVVDVAGNETSKTTGPIKIDTDAPEVTKAELTLVENPSVMDKVLNFLTFGIYSNSELVLTVSAEDKAISSSIQSIAFEYKGAGDEQVFTAENANPTKDNTASAEFKLPLGDIEVYDPAKMQFIVKDVAGKVCTTNLKALNDIAELVITEKPAIIDGISVDYEKSYAINSAVMALETTVDEATIDEPEIPENVETIYSGKGTYTTVITDTLSGFKSADDVEVFFEKDGKNEIVLDNLITNTTANEAGKITEIRVTYNTGEIDSGIYTFTVKATNNSGNVVEESKTVKVDNSAPVVDNIKYKNNNNEDWSNQPVEVTFTVRDMPEAFCGGLATIVVTGEDRTDYTVASDDEAAGIYSFVADKNQKYYIVAADVFGTACKDVETGAVKFDDTAPVVDEFAYEPDAWTNGNVTVTFTATDAPSGIETLKVTDEAGNVYEATKAEDKGEYSFVVTEYHTEFTVIATDKAGNETTATAETDVLIDKKNPSVTNVDVAIAENSGIVDKVLNFLSFGVYSNSELVLTVYAKDEAVSSAIDDITATYGDNNDKLVRIDFQSVSESPTEDNTATAQFKLPFNNKDAYDPAKLVVTVKDVAGNMIQQTLKDGLADADLNENFELVITDKPVTIDNIKIEFTKNANYNGKTIFNGTGTFSTVLTDELSGIDVSTIKTYFGHAGKELAEVSSNIEIAPNKADAKVTSAKVTYATGELQSGTYTFRIEATNNSGNVTERTATVNVDNNAPVIKDVKYHNNDNAEWKNTPVTVSFTVEEQTEFFGGIKTLTVTGNTNKKAYVDIDGKATESIGGTFDADLYQTYTIAATDVFGQKAVFTTGAPIKYDNEKPNLSNFSYENDENATWKNEDVKVIFITNDNANNALIKGTTLSDIAEITITGANGATYDEVRIDGTAEYYFMADCYQEYTVKVVDVAGNETSKTTDLVKIDTEAPRATGVALVPRENVAEKVLRFLTFGIYDSRELILTVFAKDPASSSSIESIAVEYNGTEFEQISFTHTAENEAPTEENTASAEFVLPVNNIAEYDPDKMVIIVKDIAGNDNSQYNHTLATFYDMFENVEEEFELVVSTNEALISEATVAANEDVLETVWNEKNWYSGNVTVSFDIENEIAKLYSVEVKLNGNAITGLCTIEYTAEGVSAVLPGTLVGRFDDIKTTSANISFDTAKVEQYIKLASATDSANNAGNTIEVTVESNNGVISSKTFEELFFVDAVAPEITKFVFDTTEAELSNDTANNNLTTLGIVKTDYGFYFQKDTDVVITADDIMGSELKNGSGVDKIIFTYTDVDGTSKTEEATVTNASGDVTAAFTIPAGFKGSVFAQAVDKVGNESVVYNPSNSVLETEKIHARTSNATITVRDTNLVERADARGNKLFDGNATVDLYINDTYSGLNNVTYDVTLPDGTVLATGTLTELDAKDNSITKLTDTSGVEWDVVTRDVLGDYSTNLITSLKTTIVLDTNNYNYNDITINLSGKDNSKYVINCRNTETISIDATRPEISISYDNNEFNSYGGRDYYKNHRVATITVKERNFDPADFDWSKILNAEGSVPTFVGVSNWQKHSSITDADADTVHTATVTFAQDGVYSVLLDYTDMAGNVAAQCNGGEFTIDNIDPVISVVYDNMNSANGVYYNNNRTATITVVEHNFSADSAYVTYNPHISLAGDNSTHQEPPQLGKWRHDGDTHTVEILFAEDGQYQFTFGYKDLALREADAHEEPAPFYIDHDVYSEVQFNGVEDNHAYGDIIAPQITLFDNNLDVNASTWKLTKISYDFENMKNNPSESATYEFSTAGSTSTSKVISYYDFPIEELSDGIYLLSATIVDLAGNTKSREIMFSVNRFGSTFMVLDEKSDALIDKGFTNDAPDFEIIEVNVTPVDEQNVALSHDKTTYDIKKGTDYTIKTDGGETAWYKYVYTINKENFADEGDYTLTVSSKDKTDRVVNNRTANDEGKQRTCPVAFIVDKTKPIITIEGVESGEPYRDATRDVKIMCMDTYIDQESLTVTLDGEALVAGKDYTADTTLAGEIAIDLKVGDETAGQRKHTVGVSVKDYADNATEEAAEDFTLSATWLTLFLSSPIAIISTVATLALIAIIIILIARKKKNKE
ncbi:MAG: starch-binding protein [Ruminococcus sp.]|nr:starch-binding protein [Ruminococcus sp.]